MLIPKIIFILPYHVGIIFYRRKTIVRQSTTTIHQLAYFAGRKPPGEFMVFDLAGPRYRAKLYKSGIKWKLRVSANRIWDFYPAIESQTRSLTPFLPKCHDFSKKSYSIIFSCPVTTEFLFFNRFAWFSIAIHPMHEEFLIRLPDLKF